MTQKGYTMSSYLLLGTVLLLLMIPAEFACTASQYNANGVCLSCDVTCLTCTASTTTSCVTCESTTRSITAQTSCQCKDGYVENTTPTSTCSKLTCHYSCVTCNNTITACTSCSTTNLRVYVSATNSCPCMGKYFDNGVALCVACHYSCGLCTGIANSTCTYCDSTAFRTLTSNTCLCNNGYYDAGVYTCAACDHSCATCTINTTNCLTCGPNRGTGPNCLCNTGFYDDGVTNACIVCDISCQNCSDGTSCNLCNSANFRVATSLSSLCLCMNRYYSTGAAACVACDPRCFTCLSPTVCLTCNTTAYRTYQSSSKFCICMIGFYETSATTELCAACDSRCLTCQTSSTNCLTCDPSMNRVLSGTACPCKTGFYQNAYFTCSACDTTCYTCTNITACTSCISSTLMTINSSNLCSCPNIMFYNTTLSICQTCNYRCATCNSASPTICLSCPTGSHRTYAASTCACNQYYYDNGVSATCLICDHSCLTCSSSTATSCLTCTTAAYRYLSSGSCLCQALYYDNGVLELCQPCMYNCLTCVDAVSCSSCNSTQYRTLNSSVTPITCSCMKYYFQNSNKVCIACLYHCLTCNALTNCLTCDAARYRTFNLTTQLCDCMPGYYDNFVGQTCLPCLPECYTCTNSTACTSCSATLYRALSSTKLCPCVAPYFDVSGVCTGCMYSCKTCTSATTCATCNGTAYRALSSDNHCLCSANYFDDSIHQLCLPCSYACLTCQTSAQKCLTCDPTLRTLTSNWCACPQYFYDNNSTVACPPCHYTCSSCSASSACLVCNATNHRIFDLINQYCICAIAFYDDGSNQLCLSCNYRCQSCTNSTECLTCGPTTRRATPAQMCPCLDGYYDDGSSAICPNCQYTCSTCTSSSVCLSCEATTNHRTFASNYLCKCLDRFFDDGLNHQLCQPCVYSCMTCISSSTTCTTCNTTAHRSLAGSSCPCLQHFYDNLVEHCLPCHYSCLTCVGPTLCSTCSATAHRHTDSSTGQCSCINMFFDDTLNNELCLPCQPTCLTCLDTLSCITCNVTRSRMLNSSTDIFGISSPFCVCLYRHYSPGLTQDCQPCHYSCQVCSGPARTNCVYCNTTALRIFNSSTIACPCLVGYYDNNVSELCQPCNVACTACTTGLPNSCTSCNPLYFLLIATTTCYSTCPGYYYNVLLNMTCQSCSPHCYSCLNNTYCSQCDSTAYLFNSSCLAICPDGTYTSVATRMCIDCPTGCKTCSGSSQCFTCFDKYYFNSSLGFCFSCNSVCLTCDGPGQTQCKSCASPLFLKGNSCSVLSCPMGTYVNPIRGCVSCNNLFTGSSSCNSSVPFGCGQNYRLINNTCVFCSSIPGYTIVSNGKCGQICGDGVVIYLQCDDGNLEGGDGCSSNCLIEAGWICNSTGTASACNLINPPAINVVKINKQGGSNIISAAMEVSLPILVRTRDFTVSISGLTSSQYSYSIAQNSGNLSLITLAITYQADLQGRDLVMSYSRSRRLQFLQADLENNIQNKQRVLTAVTFSNSFSLSTYPPANYYPDSTFTRFQVLQSYIGAMAISLLVLCFILIPKRMHLHSLTVLYIPAQILLTYGLVADDFTDWIKFCIKNIKSAALVGGTSFGDCCVVESSFFDITSEIANFSGISILIMIISWILLIALYAFNRSCLRIQSTFKHIAYFLLTLNLALLFPIIYSSINSLHLYSLLTPTDTFNTTFGVFLSIFGIIAIASIWLVTYFTSNPKHGNRKVHAITDKEVIFNIPLQSEKNSEKSSRQGSRRGTRVNILDSEIDTGSIEGSPSRKLSIEDNKEVDSKQSENFLEILVFDYMSLYNHSTIKQIDGRKVLAPSKAKYFLPILFTKLYLTAFFSSVLSSHPFEFFIVSSLLQILCLVYLLGVRPFISCFSNFRLVLISMLILGCNSSMGLYLFYAKTNTYIIFYEQLTVYLILALLGFSVLSLALQHILAWKREMWNMVEPCLKGTRLMGTRKMAVFELEMTNQVQSKESFKVSKTSFGMSSSSLRGARREEAPEQMDAFFARMLKKDQLNRKYRRQRMIR